MLEQTQYSKITPLRLVYPPVSNQEAEWLAKIPEVEARWRHSDFYMIAGRAEAFFDELSVDKDSEKISFEFRVGGLSGSPCTIHVRELPGVQECGDDGLLIELGPKFIRIWRDDQNQNEEEPLTWFTTERLLYERSRNHPGIYGLENHLDLATYDLLYVGIAKVGDTYDRLIAQGHKARQSILSSEPQRYPGARPTDEIYLFFFRLHPLFLTQFGLDHDFSDDDFTQPPVEMKRVVADAEKAYVSLLKPGYNHVRFKSYPKGIDGLYGTKLVRYGYLIGEHLVFRTAHGEIRGAWNHKLDVISNKADSLFVEGNDVALHRSGIDFPSDDPEFE